VNKNFVALVLFFAFSISLQAQRGWEIGGGAGVSYYFGDLNTRFNLSHPGLSAGLSARYNFNNRICLKFSGTFGQIGADDAYSANVFEKRRNLNFKSNVWDGTAQIEFNFLPYVHGSRDNFFTPYLLGGFSVFKFNPKGRLNGTWYELASLGTEGQFRGEEYYTTQAGFTYGGGFKIDLNADWSMNIEFSARRLFTDYLDDVSTVYPNVRDLERSKGKLAAELSDPSIVGIDGQKLGVQGRQRGNSNTKDTYMFVGVSFMYYFATLDCPKWR
jgi:opacity protein-like surface antigen